MSIVAHYYGVLGILITILLNMFYLKKATNLEKYQRQMRIFTPLSSFWIGSILFTGVIMMASKHLEFSIENNIMILFSIAIIVLEVKRAKNLKYLKPSMENALEDFKVNTFYIFLIEILLTLSISIWMWL